LEIGRIRKLRNGSDITIGVCGVPVYMAIEAAQQLAEENISVDLLEISTIKPMDTEALISSVSKTGKMLTVEEHNVIGGLGSAVAETLSRYCPVKMHFVGIEDTFTESGPYMELMAKYGISVEAIVKKVKLLMDV
jgi:transketolase